ncbi:hypothetical protein HNQ91_003762 [Filimonas zeae]|uniref:DUF4251 domain-containing protein n=1 Tax=Filimonas zeae TaxID=1737353 RepID=A0A917J1S2_9BACT|nr:DUF4251 domain-containing protein [Filimonas zeae]MDR6340697.1 hypothetical protein [Filimonas zeae]GGH73944.1 hypothetical protein GCM10011379_36030 [Filimonas zeae]
MKTSPYTCLFAVLLLLVCPVARAQDSTAVNKNGERGITAAITAKRYLFNAQTATPMSGRVIQLTYGYDVKVKQDTLKVYLPYFGRAFAAPLDASKGGINFTSTQFKYVVKERRKGGWDIRIEPSDAGDVRTLNFTISQDGYTTLQVTSNNRQPISFYGVVSESGSGK